MKAQETPGCLLHCQGVWWRKESVMRNVRVVIYLLGLVIVLLLIWQLYGVHHGKLNETAGFNRVVITAPVNILS